ncbi:MAG: hypothetical protein AAB578_08010 [Elusimicrobiota bacterium]
MKRFFVLRLYSRYQPEGMVPPEHYFGMPDEEYEQLLGLIDREQA